MAKCCPITVALPQRIRTAFPKYSYERAPGKSIQLSNAESYCCREKSSINVDTANISSNICYHIRLFTIDTNTNTINTILNSTKDHRMAW